MQRAVDKWRRREAVAYLDHELLDNTVEDGALVVQGLASLADTLLASAEAAEVLGGLGNEVGVQLHGDATGRLAADGDIEEDTGPRGLGLGFGGHCEGGCVCVCVCWWGCWCW